VKGRIFTQAAVLLTQFAAGAVGEVAAA